jgi:hypothetical protein
MNCPCSSLGIATVRTSILWELVRCMNRAVPVGSNLNGIRVRPVSLPHSGKAYGSKSHASEVDLQVITFGIIEE